MFDRHFDRLHSFLQNLECLSPAGQFDAFCNECVETGGVFNPPKSNQSHFWEIDLHGTYAIGGSAQEVIRNWKKVVRASLPMTVGQ